MLSVWDGHIFSPVHHSDTSQSRASMRSCMRKRAESTPSLVGSWYISGGLGFAGDQIVEKNEELNVPSGTIQAWQTGGETFSLHISTRFQMKPNVLFVLRVCIRVCVVCQSLLCFNRCFVPQTYSEVMKLRDIFQCLAHFPLSLLWGKSFSERWTTTKWGLTEFCSLYRP